MYLLSSSDNPPQSHSTTHTKEATITQGNLLYFKQQAIMECLTPLLPVGLKTAGRRPWGVLLRMHELLSHMVAVTVVSRKPCHNRYSCTQSASSSWQKICWRFLTSRRHWGRPLPLPSTHRRFPETPVYGRNEIVNKGTNAVWLRATHRVVEQLIHRFLDSTKSVC